MVVVSKKEKDLQKARELERLSRKHDRLSKVQEDEARKLRRKHAKK